jgi:hypothetical protein
MTPDYDVTTFETWRLKAEEDFTAASILAEHGGPAATICFLCQQVAETPCSSNAITSRVGTLTTSQKTCGPKKLQKP